MSTAIVLFSILSIAVLSYAPAVLARRDAQMILDVERRIEMRRKRREMADDEAFEDEVTRIMR